MAESNRRQNRILAEQEVVDEHTNLKSMVTVTFNDQSIFNNQVMADQRPESSNDDRQDSLHGVESIYTSVEQHALIKAKERKFGSSVGPIAISTHEQMGTDLAVNDSKMEKSQTTQKPMNKSYAGFGTGDQKSVGCFYASMRQNLEASKAGDKTALKDEFFVDTAKSQGKEYVADLIKQQEERYQKKFAFERSQFHQSIPNPKVENQIITVQFVQRVLQGLETGSSNKSPEAPRRLDMEFRDDTHKRITNISQQYQRCKLVTPDTEIEQFGSGEGEDEGEGDDKDELQADKDLESEEKLDKDVIDENQTQGQDKTGDDQKLRRTVTRYEKVQEELYEPKNLFVQVNEAKGVSAHHYANVAPSDFYDADSNAMTDCDQYAVIGFWDLVKVDDTFKCNRFFVAPDPFKRTIRNCEETELHQVLYSSPHSKDVFFFYRGYGQSSGDDLNEVSNDEKKMICAILKLDPTEDEKSTVLESRHLKHHCERTLPIDETSFLAEFIRDLDSTGYDEQDQLPNPTLIDSVGRDSTGKTVVFTSYQLEKSSDQSEVEASDSQEDEEEKEKKKKNKNWYPTIYFYDTQKNEMDWQIYGAEIFVGIDGKNVTIVANEIWNEITKQEYIVKEEEDPEDFSIHWEYDTYMMQLRYKAEQEPENLEEQAPKIPQFRQAKLNFKNNLKLDITKDVKVVEAYLHNTDRLTLVYQDLGAFTFVLSKAKSLTELNLWYGEYENHQFWVNLQLTQRSGKMHKLCGKGRDENGDDMEVQITLQPEAEKSWLGYFSEGNDMNKLLLERLTFDKKKFQGEWTDEETSKVYNIYGTIKLEKATQNYNRLRIVDRLDGHVKNKVRSKLIEFTLEERHIDTQALVTRYFDGTINESGTHMKGKWSDKPPSETKIWGDDSNKKQYFDFVLCDQVQGDMRLTFKGKKEKKYDAPIQIDFKEMEIKNSGGSEKTIKEFYAIDAVDTADIYFFILQKDVNFLTTGSGASEKAYIQAKLKAEEKSEDINSNGEGVARSTVNLYNISFEKPPITKKDNLSAETVVKEPDDRKHIEFCLNQSYLKVQEKQEIQLWYVCPSFISSDNRIFGSVIYEDYSTDDLCLNFFSAPLDQEYEDGIQRDYPQQPLPQTWIVDYPLLAYKTVSPDNKEIAIVHMAQNMHQRIIHLGEWEFVCFVNHTQMVEQKLFGKKKETNCDIMFLVRREGKMRLMSFKSNPWLKVEQNAGDHDEDIYKQAIFIFDGWLSLMPHEEEDNKTNIEDNQENRKRFCRRFNSDKIQSVQLITKTGGSKEQYMVIMQFNDSIVMNSLNRTKFEIICKPEAMVRRHMVRGYDEKVYYCESHGSAEKIFQLGFHSSRENMYRKDEIWQLTGSWLVAFELDGECIVDDRNEDEIKQSLFVMDDHQKIYLLQNNDNIRFVVTKVIDFSRHNKLQEIFSLRDNDWTHVHITERTLTFGEKTYNLANTQSVDVQVPQAYFGQEREISQILDSTVEEEGAEQNFTEDQDGEDDDSEDEDKTEISTDWRVQSIQGMPMTTNVIAQCQRNHKDFCFLVKPSPGSRKINIVGFQQLLAMEKMLFASNNHVFCKFTGGKAVTLLSNGCILHQKQRVQNFLEQNSKIVGESTIQKGEKIVFLEQEYGEDLEKVRYISIRFNRDGEAFVTGIFNDYQDQMSKQLKNFNKKYHPTDSRGDANDLKLRKESSVQEVGGMINIQGDADVDDEAQRKKAEVLRKKQEEKNRIKIKYSGDYFITSNGEIIKFAAIIAKDRDVKNSLREQRDTWQKSETKHKIVVEDEVSQFGKAAASIGLKKRPKKQSKILKQTTREQFITVFEIPNTDEGDNTDTNQNVSRKENQLISKSQIDTESQDEKKKNESKCKFKVVAFHCLDEKGQRDIIKNTQICVVGNNLCYRQKDKQIVWIMKLRTKEQKEIPVNVFQSIAGYEGGEQEFGVDIRNVNREHETRIKSSSHSVQKMVDSRDLEHIQMTEVPKAYFTTIKEIKDNQMIFHEDLLQITVRNRAIHLDLDGESPREISQIENIDQIQDPDKSVNSGFVMSSSRNDIWEDQEFVQRTQVFTNEYCNLLFWRKQDRYKDQKKKDYENKISGMLFRTFSEIDLWQLDTVMKAVDKNQKINQIDPESIVCTYEGHTIFSIFFDRIQVYEQIMDQMKATEFNNEEDEDGQEREHNYLRRLYRILHLPTGDFLRYDHKPEIAAKQKLAKQLSEEAEANSWIRKASAWTKRKIGIRDLPQGEHNGFKPIPRKSLYFSSSRYQETLMEVAMICQENSLTDFVGDLQDMTVMLNSMSPAIQEFMGNSFNQSRYTRKIKNLDWKIGKPLLVFGKKDSVITKNDKDLKKFADLKETTPEMIQNRQVEVSMLDIGWIFASDVGFRELIVSLSNTPHESVFSTDLVIILVEIFAAKYKAAIMKWCFIPYVFYFFFSIMFYTYFTSAGIHQFSDGEIALAFLMGVVIIVLDCYFLFYEFVSIMRDGWGYLTTDFFNYVDLGTAALNLWLVFETLSETEEHGMGDREYIKNWTALAVVLMWIKSFYWIRLFTKYSQYVRLIKATLYDIRRFFTIFVLLLMAFGNALMILNEGRYQENELIVDTFGWKFFDALMNQYLLALGEFQLDSFGHQRKDSMVWILFILSTFIAQITFLNMLIAVMADTFDKVKEVEKQSALKETIELMSDYVVSVPRFSDIEKEEKRFIFAVQPKALAEDEAGDWEGTVTQLKRYLKTAVDSLKTIITKRMTYIGEEVGSVTKRIDNLDDKMNEVYGIQQKLGTSLTSVDDNVKVIMNRGDQEPQGQMIQRPTTGRTRMSDVKPQVSFEDNTQANDLNNKVTALSDTVNQMKSQIAELKESQNTLLPSLESLMRQILQENSASAQAQALVTERNFEERLAGRQSLELPQSTGQERFKLPRTRSDEQIQSLDFQPAQKNQRSSGLSNWDFSHADKSQEEEEKR